MKILIGENIKRLRKMRNITQEELAEVFNITPAAVCKWETCETYPDITLLFPLAHYFGVTIDELMGYDEEKVIEEINKIINKYWDLYFKREMEKANELITNTFKKYPNDCNIMHLYMWDKAGGNADNDPTVLLDNKDEFLDICDKILANSNDVKLCLASWNMKAKILHAEGKTDEALNIYEERYPNFYHTSNQKKEQLFAKNTSLFAHYLSLNIYELTDFVLNKKMKEIWFTNGLDIKEKLNESNRLINMLDDIRIIYKNEDMILGEYSVASELVDYLKRFDAEKDDIILAEAKKEELRRVCNVLSNNDLKLKNYIKKAYQVNDL